MLYTVPAPIPSMTSHMKNGNGKDGKKNKNIKYHNVIIKVVSDTS